MRRLRLKLINADLPRKHELMARRDFYTRSEFKDLVANNREKNYTPADLAALLAGLPVRIAWFKGIEGDDMQALDNDAILARVEQVEKANPRVNAGMFMFALLVKG